METNYKNLNYKLSSLSLYSNIELDFIVATINSKNIYLILNKKLSLISKNIRFDDSITQSIYKHKIDLMEANFHKTTQEQKNEITKENNIYCASLSCCFQMLSKRFTENGHDKMYVPGNSYTQNNHVKNYTSYSKIINVLPRIQCPAAAIRK